MQLPGAVSHPVQDKSNGLNHITVCGVAAIKKKKTGTQQRQKHTQTHDRNENKSISTLSSSSIPHTHTHASSPGQSAERVEQIKKT